MFSKTKENILFALIFISIITMSVKALTITGRYDEMNNNLEKKIEACKTEISSLKAEVNKITQAESDNISIRNLEKKSKNYKHNVPDVKVVF